MLKIAFQMFLKFELNVSWRTTPLELSTALLYKTASSHLLSAGSGLHRYTAVSTKFVPEKRTENADWCYG